MCRTTLPSVQHLKIKCRQLNVAMSLMPWTERTIELQFIDKYCQKTVQRLAACRDIKLTQEPLRTILGLDDRTFLHCSDSAEVCSSLGRRAMLITARKGLLWAAIAWIQLKLLLLITDVTRTKYTVAIQHFQGILSYTWKVISLLSVLWSVVL